MASNAEEIVSSPAPTPAVTEVIITESPPENKAPQEAVPAPEATSASTSASASAEAETKVRVETETETKTESEAAPLVAIEFIPALSPAEGVKSSEADAAAVGNTNMEVSVPSDPEQGQGQSSLLSPAAQDAEGRRPSFVKTLSSEVNDSEAYELLQEVRKLTPKYYAEFTDYDIRLLAEYLSVLQLDVGESIIQKGERATFCGIILKGVFEVDLFSLKVRLEPGSMVGEMNYFDGGNRTANVVTKEAGVLGVMSFRDLDRLKETDPELRLKITYMLGQATIDVLKRIGTRAEKKVQELTGTAPAVAPIAPPSSKTAKDVLPSGHVVKHEEEVENAREFTHTKRDTIGKDKSPSANAAHKQEMLFRSRIAKQTKLQEEMLERDRNKLNYLTHAIFTQQHQVKNRENKIKKLEDDILDKDVELARLHKLEKELVPELAEVKEFSKRVLVEKAKLQQDVTTLEKQIDELKSQYDSFVAQTESRDSAKITELKRQIVTVNMELQKLRLTHDDLQQQHAHQSSTAADELKFERDRRRSAFTKYEAVKDSIANLESVVQGQANPNLTHSINDINLRQYAQAILDYRTQISEMKETIEQLQSLSAVRASENILQREEMKKMDANLQRTEEAREKLSNDLHNVRLDLHKAKKAADSFNILLKHVAFYQYAARMKIRRRLRMIQENLGAIGTDLAAALDNDTDAARSVKACKKPNEGVETAESLSKAVVDEADKIAIAYGELVRQKAQWKATCDTFFHDNITMKTQVMKATEDLKREQSEKAELLEMNNELKISLDRASKPGNSKRTSLLTSNCLPRLNSSDIRKVEATPCNTVGTVRETRGRPTSAAEVASLKSRVKQLEEVNARFNRYLGSTDVVETSFTPFADNSSAFQGKPQPPSPLKPARPASSRRGTPSLRQSRNE